MKTTRYPLTYYFAIDSFNEAGVTIGKEIKTTQ